MFSLALKNIRYYKGRSLTTFLLIFIATYFFIVYVAFMNGAHSSMLKNALDVYTGSLEIFHKGYRSEGGYDYLIEENQKIFSTLKQTEGLKAYSSRLETYGIASHKEYSSAIMLTGVDFTKETKLSELKKARTEGLYNSQGACLYMGEDLAKKLQVTLGSRMSFVGSAIDYSFVAERFEVCGLFKTGMYEFDTQSAFMNREYFDTIFFSKDKSTYIVAMVKDMKQNDLIASSIAKKLPKDIELYTWKELMKSMLELMQMDSFFGYISMALFFLVIFFVIMIYGFINVSARIKEFGTLQSIGVSEQKISRLLFYEVLILTLFALALATPLGAFTAYYFEVHPIVIAGMSDMYKSYGVVSDKVPTLFEPFTIAWNTLLVFLLNLASVIYPILYVRSFTPVEAMHHV